ncbi:hypothetical protein HK099_005649 [Clydaea vesicula]|uniref:Uncharacterized protein n=1 Tax=Clydaea vesicula TaxID=447962 RepID=A0AAD5U8H0_9FUNG|nr:hypothetical protein HK099_005649 [Clydaea vesicula]
MRANQNTSLVEPENCSAFEVPCLEQKFEENNEEDFGDHEIPVNLKRKAEYLSEINIVHLPLLKKNKLTNIPDEKENLPFFEGETTKYNIEVEEVENCAAVDPHGESLMATDHESHSFPLTRRPSFYDDISKVGSLKKSLSVSLVEDWEESELNFEDQV